MHDNVMEKKMFSDFKMPVDATTDDDTGATASMDEEEEEEDDSTVLFKGEAE